MQTPGKRRNTKIFIYGWQFLFIRSRNLFLGINISLYASVGIISKHSLHISTISQNKKLIHSQHDSTKLSRSMSTPGIFIFKSHGRHFLFAKSVIYKCSPILVLIYIASSQSPIQHRRFPIHFLKST